MPADYTTENGKVRYNIGDITEPYIIADAVIDALLALHPDDTEEVRIWRVTIKCLKLMKAQAAGSGERRREREGGVEIEVYQSQWYAKVSDLLDWWERNPPDSIRDPSFSGFFFGGVSAKERARVNNNPDSVGPGVAIHEEEDEFTPDSFVRRE